jgi:Family of unknown function (DUF6081)
MMNTEEALANGGAIYDDFTTSVFPSEKWYRHLPVPGVWDPATRVSCGGGTLTLDARPFTFTRRDAHDNVKALIYSTAEFSLGDSGLLTVETEMRVTTSATEANPFAADAGDVRLGCGAFNTIDTRTFMVFDFFVSNSRIVPLYERLPFAQSKDNPYPAFTELISISIPTAAGQWHRYAITYDRAGDRAEWLVDGEVVAMRASVGAPPGEKAPIVKIDGLKIGGGLFTMFGDLNNDRARSGDGAKIPGLDPLYRRCLFGQGVKAEFKPFKITRS